MAGGWPCGSEPSVECPTFSDTRRAPPDRTPAVGLWTGRLRGGMIGPGRGGGGSSEVS